MAAGWVARAQSRGLPPSLGFQVPSPIDVWVPAGGWVAGLPSQAPASRPLVNGHSCRGTLLPAPPTVAHVIDRVLLPARSLQQVLPYSQAVGGLAGSGAAGGTSAAIAGAGPTGDAVSATLAAGGTGAAATLPSLAALGQAPAGEGQQCFRSIADAIAATPSLSIVRSTLSLSGVSPLRWLLICGCLLACMAGAKCASHSAWAGDVLAWHGMAWHGRA